MKLVVRWLLIRYGIAAVEESSFEAIESLADTSQLSVLLEYFGLGSAVLVSFHEDYPTT